VKEDDGIEHFLPAVTMTVFCSLAIAAWSTASGRIKSQLLHGPVGCADCAMLPIPRDEKITSVVPVSEFTRDEYADEGRLHQEN